MSLLLYHCHFVIFVCLSVCLYLQPRGECPWLAYTTLCAEQGYEEEEGIWKALLQQLRQDPKATVDTALKVLLGGGGGGGGGGPYHLSY